VARAREAEPEEVGGVSEQPSAEDVVTERRAGKGPDPFVLDELANQRCKTTHPKRWRQSRPCRECVEAVADAAPLASRLERIIKHEIATEIEALCLDALRASGSVEHATVRVDRLRAVLERWRQSPRTIPPAEDAQ
jgi:hypothetical protein